MIVIRIKPHGSDVRAANPAEWFELTVNTAKTVVWFLAMLRRELKPDSPHDCELHGLSKSAQRTVALQFGMGWENFSIKIPD